MTTIVTTQAELDAALAAKTDVIYIESPVGARLCVLDSGSSRVVAWGSSRVVAWDSSRVDARGSSHVDARDSSHVVAWGSSRVVAWGSSRVDAWDSSHVDARGSSHVDAWGSSHVVARGSSRVVAWDSSRVDAWDSSHVDARDSSHVDAWDSSHVDARGSSHVDAGRWTAVHLHSQQVTLSGGVVIDMTAIDRTDPTTWCELNGVTVTDGLAVLYKATDETFTAGQNYRPVTYTPGSEVACEDWRDDNDCGGGLHLSPTPACARAYRMDAQRYVAVQVAVADLRPIPGGTAKCKVPRGRVLHEVDLWLQPVEVSA